MNVAEWLRATAAARPDAPAVFVGTRLTMTYSLMVERVRALAQGLSERGIRPGDRVAIFMRNRPEYLELFYAAWWLGAVVVPINHKLHPLEAAWIVENSGARLLFNEEPASAANGSSPTPAHSQICVGSPDWQELVGAHPTAELPTPVAEDDVAWIFYSSGTTGRPKGVMLTHQNLRIASLAYALDVDQPSADQVTLYAAPISHGAGIYNFIFVRVGGGHVFPESSSFDPGEIARLSLHFGQTVMFAAPTMVKRMIEWSKPAGYKGEGIRTIVYGGGPMYAADIEEALALFGPRFVQIYGQAETPMTITSLRREIIADRSHPRHDARRASVGQAMASVEIRVASATGGPVAPGEPGEVLVRGPTVMKGYWNNPDATAATLADGWLHTGDIGYVDEDGFLTLTDRSKDVIISGGANIYPREVEEVLARHPAVLEVSVVGARSAEWGEDVVAFLVLRDGATCSEAELERWCLREIASFKKPKRYVFSDELPKNSYGKILKTELRSRLGA